MPFAERVFEALVDLVLLVGEEGITVGDAVVILRAHWVNGRACGPAGAVGALTVYVRAAVRVCLTNKESLKSDRGRNSLLPCSAQFSRMRFWKVSSSFGIPYWGLKPK